MKRRVASAASDRPKSLARLRSASAASPRAEQQQPDEEQRLSHTRRPEQMLNAPFPGHRHALFPPNTATLPQLNSGERTLIERIKPDVSTTSATRESLPCARRTYRRSQGKTRRAPARQRIEQTHRVCRTELTSARLRVALEPRPNRGSC